MNSNIKKEKLILEKDTVYELDLECLRKKAEQAECIQAFPLTGKKGKNNVTDPTRSV